MSDEGSYEHILFAVEDGVATITFNRPERMNAYHFALGDAGVRSFLERRPPKWKLRASTDLPQWPEE